MSNTANKSASKRIEALLDDNSFVEIGALVTARSTDFNIAEKNTPSDGVVTGYGVINGNLVYVYSQDAEVMGGSIGEMHAKKIVRLYDMAMKMGAPVIGLVDCAGIRLQESTDALNAFGEIYMKQTLASGVIPQITAVFGNCGGGLGVFAGLTDYTLVEENNGKLFINSPNTIEGNNASKCDTASAKFQYEAGNADYIADEASIINRIREIVSILPANNEDDDIYGECTDDINRVCAELSNCAEDTAIALANISDNNLLIQVKEGFAKSMVTGFIKLNGITVGAVANRTKVYDEEMNLVGEFEAKLSPCACQKATEFVEFCDAFNIPVLTLTNVEGFKACECSEKKMMKAAAKLTYAFANATVPKVNVVIGSAMGTPYVIMNSKSIGADVVYAWTDAKIGMMDSKSAARIMYADEINVSDDAVALINEKAAEYDSLQSNIMSAAKRGYVDTIISPADTRKYVIAAFEMLYAKREERPAKKHGTV
ncbi:MAG: carboxyl transferase [Lachnospiraceae bacterium]|nr:carboxyl transferase [Lachnospiraceae bacterium]